MLPAIVIVLWATIAVYFLWRFFRFRKLPSLALSFMSAGWLLFGLERLIGGSAGSQVECGLAIGIGVFFWVTVVQVERSGR